MAVADYLTNLIEARDDLKTLLVEKGVDIEEKNTLCDLVPMVGNISVGTQEEPIEKVLYSFGVLSDIHVKNENRDSDVTDTKANYIRALNFYKRNNANFVCVAGDIIWNGGKGVPELENSIQYWSDEVQLFKALNDEYFNNAETGQCVFATTGNHDASLRGYAHGDYGLNETATYYKDGTMTGEEAWTDIVGTSLNHAVVKGDDVFLFVGMYYWNYVSWDKKGDDDFKNWLARQLETYKDKRVFLFFHPYMIGTFDNLLGNLSDEGVPMGKTTGSASRFEPLVKSYKNVVWFSGHSHIDMACEGNANFENPNTYQSGESMTMVHIPSCAFLRKLDSTGTSYTRKYGTSQGLWVDVYANKIVVKSIDFAAENGGAFIPSANYVINNKFAM